jgi:hypothetical protein
LATPDKPKEDAPKSPPKQATVQRPPSPEHVQVQPSPKPKTPASPPKPQFTSPRLDQQSPKQLGDAQLPPGLSQSKATRKQDTPVVMPGSTVLSNSGVQFGSFKVESEKQPSPDRVEEQHQQSYKIKSSEPTQGAPGLVGQFQQQYAHNGLNGMPEYNGAYDDRMVIHLNYRADTMFQIPIHTLLVNSAQTLQLLPLNRLLLNMLRTHHTLKVSNLILTIRITCQISSNNHISNRCMDSHLEKDMDSSNQQCHPLRKLQVLTLVPNPKHPLRIMD